MELTIIILLLCYIILYFLRRPETTLRHNREGTYRLRVYFFIILREYNVDNEKKNRKKPLFERLYTAKFNIYNNN